MNSPTFYVGAALFCLWGVFIAAEVPPVDSCEVSIDVFDENGVTLTDYTLFVWRKIDSREGGNPLDLVFAADGSVWKRMRDTGYPENLRPGTYRAGFVQEKRFLAWEGPPGTRKSGESHSNGQLVAVRGTGHPVVITATGISDAFEVKPGEKSKRVTVTAERGPKVAIRPDMRFFELERPDPFAEEREDEALQRERGAAPYIAMQVLRDDGFPLFEQSDYFGGLPYYLELSAVPPGRYTVSLAWSEFGWKESHPALTPPESTDTFTMDVTEGGENIFRIKPEKSLAPKPRWVIRGRILDEKGKPIRNLSVNGSYSHTLADDGFNHSFTNEDGRYRLELSPHVSASGFAKDENGRWRYGFRLQHVAVDIRKDFKPVEVLRRSKSGEILLLGCFADEELRKQIADWPEPTLLVPMDEPLEIDFAVKRPPEKEPVVGFSFDERNYWERQEPIPGMAFYRQKILPLSMSPAHRHIYEKSRNIRAWLSLRPNRVRLGEPVTVMMTVHNDNATPVAIGTDHYSRNKELSLRILAKDGRVISLAENVTFSSDRHDDYRGDGIPPGQSQNLSYRLEEGTQLPTEPGQYTIQVGRTQMILDDPDRGSDPYGKVFFPLQAEAILTVLP